MMGWWGLIGMRSQPGRLSIGLSHRVGGRDERSHSAAGEHRGHQYPVLAPGRVADEGHQGSDPGHVLLAVVWGAVVAVLSLWGLVLSRAVLDALGF